MIALLILLLMFCTHQLEGACRTLEIGTVIEEKSLTNHTIRTIQAIKDVDHCVSLCYLESRCFGFNFCVHQDSTAVCELTDSDHVRSDKDLINKPGCTFYGSESECSSNPCPRNATCQGDFLQDTRRSYRCICPAGYTGQNCELDIDECALAIHTCHVNATCSNTMGGHECVCQNNGYQYNGYNCEDINECTSGTHGCSEFANCTNLPGGHNCTCKSGFHGDGKQCHDINECSSDAHCHVNATCMNTIGGYNCICNVPSYGNGKLCYYPENCTELRSLLDRFGQSLNENRVIGSGTKTRFCVVTNISGCESSRPWTLAMKINGSMNTFEYNSPLWTNNLTFNPEASFFGLDNKETKSSAYWDTPLNKLCIGMKYGGIDRWLSFDVQASSLLDVMSQGQEILTSVGKEKWRSLLPREVTSLEMDCNKEGFNLNGGKEQQKRLLRLGFFTDSGNLCNSYGSFLGLASSLEGLFENDKKPVCGNYAISYSDNGKMKTTAFCYILIQ